MSMPTIIRVLSVETLDIPLHMPFGIAGGAQDVARNLLVTVELADGTRGYGEAAPFPAFNGETQEIARAAIQAAHTTIEGADVREWRRIAAALRGAMGPIGSAQCAIETAILDALTRHAQIPLWAFFGGVSTSLETDMTITTGSIEQAGKAARDIVARGIRTIKVKVGGRGVQLNAPDGGQLDAPNGGSLNADLALDLERVGAIRAAAPSAALILDGNGGLSADATLQLLSTLHQRGIVPVLVEQPVHKDDWDGLRQVSQWGGVPVAADESVANPGDTLRLIQERAAQVVNIKLMKSGIVEALEIAALCRAAHLRLMIGGMVESTLAMTASACFAAGLGGFSYVDLDTPLFMAENPFTGGMAYEGGRLDLSQITAGHGVTPRPVP